MLFVFDIRRELEMDSKKTVAGGEGRLDQYLVYAKDLARRVRSEFGSLPEGMQVAVFEKTLQPMVYWKSGSGKVITAKKGTLSDVVGLYGLRGTPKGFVLSKYVGKNKFAEVADKMRTFGYEYNHEDRAFQKG